MSDHVPIPEGFALGVCYYPEHWPQDRWKHYAQQMREMGLSYARLAEFAWSRIEPARNVWNWAWLDEAIESLANEGIQVILGTPTAGPPAWLIREHPEILPWDIDGRMRDFGSRRHYDFSSPVYRAESQRITRALAERYGQHPAVVGWQTDNEFGCHGNARSYSPAARDRFRQWLEQRYEAISALNEAWGNVFWSMEYNDWSQINLPNLTMTTPNPSHVLDFDRFSSDMVAEFQDEQIAILRELSPDRWITHNFMMSFTEIDHYRVAAPLDVVSWDSYPIGQLERADLSHLNEEAKRHFVRTGHPDLISFHHDLYRGVNDTPGFWVMEQGAGQVNWAPSNALPADGAVALWAAQAYGHGANAVVYFRWRAATMAQELMHSGLLRHDETVDRGGEEIAALDLPGRENSAVQPEVVLLHDYESLWAYDNQPHSAGASYWRQMLLFYTAIRALGVDVDIRHPQHDMSNYRVIIAPALQIMDSERAAHLTEAAKHAKLVFGPRTAYRTPTGQVPSDGQPGVLSELLGWKLLNFDGMPTGLTTHVNGHEVAIWAENYRPTTGQVLATYDDGPLTGTAAVVQHDSVTTIGAWSPTLITEILTRIFGEVGIATTPLPEGVRVSRRGDSEIWVNFNDYAVTLPDGGELGAVSYRINPKE